MNHWMKKIATLALLLCAALSVGLFSACTNGKGPDTPTPPADDAYTVTLTKNFTDAMGTATLTPAAGENGKYAKDTLVTLNVTVNAGYKLTSVKVGSEDVELEQGAYAFKVRSNTEVVVSMRAIEFYTLTLDFDDEHGTVTAAPAAGEDGKYQEDTPITVTVTPETGYRVKSFKVDGTDATLTEGAYTFPIAKNTTVAVEFEENFYTVTLDANLQHCDFTYSGSIDGVAQTIKLTSGTTFERDSSVTFTVVANGGYKVTEVKVNGTAVTVTDDKFTVTMDGDKTISATTVWDVEQLTTFAGTYDVTFAGEAATQTKWYTFTVGQEGAAYLIQAVNYTVYMAFFKVESLPDAPLQGDAEKNARVYIYNPDGALDHEAHFFEQGTYLVRLDGGSEDGAGAASRKQFTVTALGLSQGLPANFQGTWRSLKEDYALTVTDKFYYLTKAGAFVASELTYDDEEEVGQITFDKTTYQVMPYFMEGLLGFYQTSEAKVVFVPDPLPTVTIDPVLYGTYEDSTHPDSETLYLSSSGAKWGDKTLSLLGDLVPSKDGMGDAQPVFALFENTIYAVMAMQMGATEDGDPTYGLMIMSTEDEEGSDYYQYTPAQGGALTPSTPDKPFGTDFVGSWVNVEKDLLLVIEANSITVSTMDGLPVSYTLGTAKFNGTDYNSITIDGTTYVFYSVTGRVKTLKLMDTADSNHATGISFSTPITVTLEAGEHGKATLTPAQKYYTATSTVTLTVTPDEGYEIDVCTNNGTTLKLNVDETTGVGTLVLHPSSNMAIRVTFKEKGAQGGDTPVEPGTVTIEEKFWGVWECKIATAPLFGYVLTVSEHDIVVSKDRKNVETTLSMYNRVGTDYPAFTVNGVQYYLTMRATTLVVYPTEGAANASNFVKTSDLPAEPSITVPSNLVGKWECKIATAPLFGYVLTVSEHDIVVSKDGKNVETTLSMYNRVGTDYPAFTVNGVQYYLTVRATTLVVYPTEGAANASNFVKVTEPDPETKPEPTPGETTPTSWPVMYQGSWKSADGQYTLEITATSLTLKKGGTAVEAKLSFKHEDTFGGTDYYYIEFEGVKYEFSPIGPVSGNAAAAAICLQAQKSISFVPATLPTYSAASLKGTYAETEKGTGDRAGKEIVITADSFKWGNDTVTLLSSLAFDGQTPTVILVGSTVYIMVAHMGTTSGFEFEINAIDNTEKYSFAPKAEDTPAPAPAPAE